MFWIILAWLSSLLSGVGVAWLVVEFILYLVKDDPFNWNGMWLIAIGIVLFGISAIGLFKSDDI